MDEAAVKTLMENSTTETEWVANCNEVKRRCGGYPKFWYVMIILSGVMAATRLRYGW